MNHWLWLQVCAVTLLYAVLVAGQQYGYPVYDADPLAAEPHMAHHGSAGGGGGGGKGHGHGKATSYQLSNNWAYHAVPVYIKHHHGGGGGGDGGGGGGHKHHDFVF